MSEKFGNKKVQLVKNVKTGIYQTPVGKYAIVIGMTIANRSSEVVGDIKCDCKVDDIFLLKDNLFSVNVSLAPVSNQKLVMTENQTLFVETDIDTDVTISIMEVDLVAETNEKFINILDTVKEEKTIYTVPEGKVAIAIGFNVTPTDIGLSETGTIDIKLNDAYFTNKVLLTKGLTLAPSAGQKMIMSAGESLKLASNVNVDTVLSIMEVDQNSKISFIAISDN